MSGRTRFLLFVLMAAGALFYLHKRSMEAPWGREVGYMVLQKYKGDPVVVKDSRAWFYKLDVSDPRDERFRELPVPEEAYSFTNNEDHLEIEIRTIPFLKAEIISFRLTRAGHPVDKGEWSQGVLEFWIKSVGVCLVAAFAVAALLALLMRALGYGGVVKD
jgi:hypothetical protein